MYFFNNRYKGLSFTYGVVMRIISVFLIVFFSITPSLFAKKDNINKHNKSEYNHFRDILYYGISKDRIDTIKKIVVKKDKKYYPLIKRVLENEDNNSVVIEGIYATINLNIKEFISLISKRLYSSKDDIKAASIRALGHFKDKTKESIIMDTLKESENLWIIRASIWYLGQIKSKKSLKLMHEIFYKRNTDDDTKIGIVNAIGEINKPSSIAFLSDVLSSKAVGRYVRVFAASSIAKLGKEKAVNILKLYTDEKDIVVLKAVIEAFGKTKSNKAYPYIFSALRHDNEAIRYSGLLGIEHLKSAKAFDILSYMAYNDKDIKVRRKAIFVLSIIGGKRVIRLWLKELKANNTKLKFAIIKSLSNMNKDIAFSVIKNVFHKEENVELKKLMIEKLINLNDKKVDSFIDKLIMASKRGNSLFNFQTYYLYKVYSIRGEKGIPTLNKYITHKNPRVRKYIYYGLISNNISFDKKAILKALLAEKDKNLILYIINLFKRKRIKDSIPILRSYIKSSKDKNIVVIAKRAIEHLNSL